MLSTIPSLALRRVAFSMASRGQANARWAAARTMSTVFEGSDLPRMNGCTMHLAVKEGNVANRILCCGSCSRAESVARDHLDEGWEKQVADRHFVVITGMFRNVEVSIIGTLMGYPNTDFVVREARAVTEGPMAFIRLGSCGGLHGTKPGSVVVASSTIGLYRNPEHWSDNGTTPPYSTTYRLPGDPILTSLIGAGEVSQGLNASADSFYSSEGRLSKHFDDRNEGLLDHLEDNYADLASMEMETHHMFDLASVSRTPMAAAGCAIVYVNRHSKDIASSERVEELVNKGGLACLEALAGFDLSEATPGHLADPAARPDVSCRFPST